MSPALPALIGREPILRTIEQAREVGRAGVVLVGAGGVGKSRIAAEVLARAAARGDLPVSTVGTHAAAAIPLGALSHLLPDLSVAGGSILTTAREALAARAGGRPLTIVADDAHLLDDHSAALLLHLALGMPSFIVATIRAGEPVPDAIVALWKDGLAERIEVGVLDPGDARAVVAQVLGGDPDASLVMEVTRLAAGNPLFLRELCLAAASAGSIRERDGTWTLVRPLRASPRLVELVASRISALEGAERRALEVIAHAEPIGLRLAGRLVSSEVLLELERRGAIVLREDGRRREVRLSHPIYAEVVRSTTGPIRRAAINLELARLIQATGMRRRDDLLRVATHLLDAGEPDPSLLLSAAHETYRALDMAGTARLGAGAWDAAPTAVAGQLLGTALAFLGRYDEADAALAAGAAIADDDVQRTGLAVAQASIVAVGLGSPGEARAIIAAAHDRIADVTCRAVLHAQVGHLLALEGRPDAALEQVAPELRSGAGVPYVTAAMAAVIALGSQGAYAAQQALAGAALPETGRLWAEGIISFPPDMLRLQAERARMLLDGLAGTADARPVDLGMMAATPAADGRLRMAAHRPLVVLETLRAAEEEHLRGRPRTAAAGVAAIAPSSADLLAAPTASAWATYLAVAGDAGEAMARLELAERWTRDPAIFDPFIEPARLWVLIANGRPAEARDGAMRSLDDALRLGRWESAASLAHDLARVGGAHVAHRAMDRVGDRVEGRLAAARRQHVDGLVRGDGALLEEALEAFAAFGALLLAAEAAADAARAHRRAGSARRATGLARSAMELAAACEGARTPALLALDVPTPLTRRELEIASLAADGLSSEEISTRLFLSVRTVDNHLGHVYQKVGVSSRAQLRAVLRGVGGLPQAAEPGSDALGGWSQPGSSH